jgi:hypothetical protein
MNYIANKIIMVRPVRFGYNPQTAQSNAFQVEVDLTVEEIQAKAVAEFDAMAESLRETGIEVLVFEDTQDPFTPDSVFPNNWFSTHFDGTLCLYPMEAQARRLERSPVIISDLQRNFAVTRVLDFSDYEKTGKFLEGTGSLILDHQNRIAYACLSSRTNEELLANWATAMDFEVVKFHSFDEPGKAVYHTNVMMCLGVDFAVVCRESITDERERENFVNKLRQTGKEIIEISFEQMNSFAGNMLLLQNKKHEKFLLMSQTAFKSLNPNQIEKLETYANIKSFDIDIIEKCGGGSVRCMIAENFFPMG